MAAHSAPGVASRRIAAYGRRISVTLDGEEAGRAYLYVLTNDMHQEPFGFLEDVFVEPEFRGRKVMRELLDEVFREAHRRGLYKIVATSRFEREDVHDIYEHFGFHCWGFEFRWNTDELDSRK